MDVDGETLEAAYDLSAARNHDLDECFYLARARSADADRLVTTDRDVEALCVDESVDYVDPVPEVVLAAGHTEGD